MTLTDFVVKNFWNVNNGMTFLSVLNFPINVTNMVMLVTMKYNLTIIPDASAMDYLLVIGAVLCAVWCVGYMYKHFMWQKVNSQVNQQNPELMEVVRRTQAICNHFNIPEGDNGRI